MDKHQHEIKQEIALPGLFIVKKRYGMKIISDNGVQVNKTLVKGLDNAVVTFSIIQKVTDVLDDILMSVPKDKIDHRILRFKKNMRYNPLDEISSPTGVKGIKKIFVEKQRIHDCI